MAVGQPFSPRAKRGIFKGIPRLSPTFIIILIRYIQRFPALLALIIQLSAWGLVLFFCWLLANTGAYFSLGIVSMPILIIVLLQAIFASAISYCFNMAIWWRWIHFLFPITVCAMLMFDVPNEIYLAGFLVTLSIFWTSFRTQVPYYPSRLDVWQQMSHITEQYQTQHSGVTRIIDIGSGLGGLSLYLDKHHKNIQVEGIEIAPLPWLVSRLRSLVQRSKAIFKLGNYHALNFADYDIVFAYLSPAAMADLWEKSHKEMRSGTLLISLEFEIPTITPTQRMVQKGHERELFIYQIA